MNLRSLFLICFSTLALHGSEQPKNSHAINTHIASILTKAAQAQQKLALLKPGAFNTERPATNDIMPRTTIEQSDIDEIRESLEKHTDAFALWSHKRRVYQNFKEAPSADGKQHSDNAIINGLANRYYQDYKQRLGLDLKPKYTDKEAQEKSFNSALSFLPQFCSPVMEQACNYVHWFIDLTDLLVEKWQPASQPALVPAAPTIEVSKPDDRFAKAPVTQTLQSQMLATDQRSFQDMLNEVNQHVATFNHNIKEYLNAALVSSDEPSRYRALMFMRQAYTRVQTLQKHIQDEAVKNNTFMLCAKQRGGESGALRFIARAYCQDFTNRFDEALTKLFTPDEALKKSIEVAQSYLPIHSKAKLQLSGKAIESLAAYMQKETTTLQEANKNAPVQPASKLVDKNAMLAKTLD